LASKPAGLTLNLLSQIQTDGRSAMSLQSTLTRSELLQAGDSTREAVCGSKRNVLNSELVAGAVVAYREKRSVDDPLHQVEVIDGTVKDRQIRVLFLDCENEGLRSWVRTAQLICPWRDREAVIKDEQAEKRLRADWDDRYDDVLDKAMIFVAVATGESSGFMNGWIETPAVIERLWKRAGMEKRPLDHHLAYKDRRGEIHIPWVAVLEFCVAFCSREPAMVLSLADQYEREYEARGHMPGETVYHQIMREDAAAHAVVREWCGQAEERHRLQKEIKRLQELVLGAANDLERTGNGDNARKLRRALEGR
jgi:hypothetical protein